MYNSTNLPLSFLKIVKKVLEKQPGIIFSLIFLAIFVFGFKNLDIQGTNNIPPSMLFYGSIIFVVYIILSEIFIIIYEYLYYKKYYYDFRDENAEIKKGVITQATGIVRYDKIQNIFVDQDLWDRVFGLYDVHYETAGETSQFYSHIDGINKENSEKLVNFLNERISRDNKKNNNVQKDVDTYIPIKTIVGNNTVVLSDVEFSRENLPISRDVIKSSVIVYFLLSLFLLPFIWPVFAFVFAIPLFFLPIPMAIITNLVLGVVIVSSLAFFVYKLNTIWFENYNYKFGQEKGEILSKVIGQSTQYLYYDRIQNINITQGILDKIWDLYAVTIQTAGETGAIGIIGFKKDEAEKLKNFLLDKAKKYRSI